MEKVDFKKSLKPLYSPRAGAFADIVVPEMRYLMVDGRGDPNSAPAYAEALSWLYPVSYALKFAAKAGLGRDYVVPPLEGLWWADDPTVFVTRELDRWQWTMMIMVPEFITTRMYEDAVVKAGARLGPPPATLRLERLAEGRVLQTMHIGPYAQEGPVLARLHDEVMPKLGVTFNGPHHEIYLGDPRKTPPEKLRTILRQPVRPV